MQNRERQRKYREKHKSENEKSNVIQELGNGEEKKRKKYKRGEREWI